MSNTRITHRANSTNGVVPAAGSLNVAEIGINTGDGKIYSKMANGTVIQLNAPQAATPGGSNTQVQFNDSGSLAGGAGFTYDKTTTILSVPAQVSVGANNISNTTSQFIGNSTVNTIITSTQLSVGSNNISNTSANFVGNSTSNAVLTASTLKISNSTSNVTITIPTAADFAGATKFLRVDSTWATPAGGSGSPGGSNTQIQYNNSGAFAGFTMSGDVTVNTSTGIASITPGAVGATAAPLIFALTLLMN